MTNLPKKTLGRTGLVVTQLGLGAMELGGPDRREESTETAAEATLNKVLDLGINFIDTAPDYGLSEERIGKYISHRRSEYYLSTKCGCNITPEGERLDPRHLWTADRIRKNIDLSLDRMKVDYVDILQLHNPSVDDVKENGLVDVLLAIKETGKIRFIGISTTSPHLIPFVRMGVFDTFQIPYSAMERRHETMLTEAADAGAGVIIRGGVAKGKRSGRVGGPVWTQAEMDELLGGMEPYTFLLRFTLTHPACHATIVGTVDPSHVEANIRAAEAGPLPADIYEKAKARLAEAGEAPEA